MKYTFKRVAALGASAALVAAGVAVAGAPSASAATLNTYLGNISTQGTSGPGTAGTTADNFTFTTANPCPANDGSGNATNSFRMIMNGTGWANITIVAAGTAGVSHTGAQAFPIADNFAGLASANGVPLPTGTYLLTGFCQSSTGAAVSGKFYTQLVFSGANFTVSPIPEETTSSALVAAPTAALLGANVTLTTTVTKSGSVATLAGAVQFKDGATNLGSPVAINGSGVAATSTTALTVGSHPITAVFTADNTANVIPATQVLGSTSAPATVVISYPPTVTTSTVTGPTSGFINNAISVSSTVTAADNHYGTPAGTVSFTDNGVAIPACSGANAVALSGAGLVATASCPVTYTVAATHTISTAFTPTNLNAFVASDSTASPLVIVVASIIPTRVATEFIRTTVPAGALTITVQGYVTPSPTTPKTGDAANPLVVNQTPNSPAYPYTVTPGYDANGNDTGTGAPNGAAPGGATSALSTNVVVLPPAKLNPSGTFITSIGNMIPVVVTDTRAGDLPYNVTGALTTDFVGLTPANKIDGRNLGWTPIFIKSSRFTSAGTGSIANGATVTLTDGSGRTTALTNGAVVAPSNGIHVGEALTSGWSEGLRPTGNNTDGTPPTYPAGTRTLFSTTHGAGTIWYGANLSLQAPTDTTPDAYQATLQLTANGTGL